MVLQTGVRCGEGARWLSRCLVGLRQGAPRSLHSEWVIRNHAVFWTSMGAVRDLEASPYLAGLVAVPSSIESSPGYFWVSTQVVGVFCVSEV